MIGGIAVIGFVIDGRRDAACCAATGKLAASFSTDARPLVSFLFGTGSFSTDAPPLVSFLVGTGSFSADARPRSF